MSIDAPAALWMAAFGVYVAVLEPATVDVLATAMPWTVMVRTVFPAVQAHVEVSLFSSRGRPEMGLEGGTALPHWDYDNSAHCRFR